MAPQWQLACLVAVWPKRPAFSSYEWQKMKKLKQKLQKLRSLPQIEALNSANSFLNSQTSSHIQTQMQFAALFCQHSKLASSWPFAHFSLSLLELSSAFYPLLSCFSRPILFRFMLSCAPKATVARTKHLPAIKRLPQLAFCNFCLFCFLSFLCFLSSLSKPHPSVKLAKNNN